MGSETWLYLASGPHSFIARTNARAEPTAGSRVPVALDMERAHFFDPRSEETLT
jgi:multiple sugar transport system ATP-binding protein